jgi:hypothetical protein
MLVKDNHVTYGRCIKARTYKHREKRQEVRIGKESEGKKT